MSITRHEMPNGSEVFFRASDHAYWREANLETGKCSGRLPGVSTLVKPLDWRPDNLMTWASKRTLDGLVELVHGHDGWPDFADGDACYEALNDASLTWRHLRDKAGDRGSAAHDVLEALAEGRPYQQILDRAQAHEKGYCDAVIAWWDHRAPRPINSEQVIFSAEHGYAGRFDLRCEVNGRIWLVDLKTSKYIGTAYHAQLAGYDLAATECGIGPSDELYVLKVNDEGEFEEVRGCARPDDFLAAMDIYRRAGQIEGAARRDKKTRQAQVQEELAA